MFENNNGLLVWLRETWKETAIDPATGRIRYTGRKKVITTMLAFLVLAAVVSLAGCLAVNNTAPFVGFMIIAYVVIVLVFLFVKSFGYKNYEIDELTGEKVAKGHKNDAHLMTEEEEEKIFERVDKVEQTDKKVLGLDDNKKFISLYDPGVGDGHIQFTNSNMMICGYPGSGKSLCIVNTHIYQCQKARKSYIVTDSKGTLFRETAGPVLADPGYDVKIINFKPKEMKYSDGVEFMHTITNQMGGETMASIIMENAAGGGEKQDFWYKCEFNLLKALILYVKFASDIPEEEKTLVKVHRMLIENTVEDLISILSSIQNPEHPAYDSANSFCGATETVQVSAWSGLCIKLSLIAQPVVQQVLSHNEVDFRAPLHRPCAYYVIISDTDRSADFLSCLFFTTLFQELIDEYDSKFDHNDEMQKKLVDVEFIMDEFKNTGAIPNFDGILSVARSRHLSVEFILQDITQLQAMYPDAWHTIMNDCAAWLLIASREEETLKYFAGLTGTRNIIRESESYGRQENTILSRDTTKRISQSLQQEELMGLYRIFKMSRNKLLLNYAGENPILINKYLSINHPTFKWIKKNNQFKDPKRHLPAWRKEMQARGEDVQDEYVPSGAAPAPSSYAKKHQNEDAQENTAEENKRPQKKGSGKPQGKQQKMNDWQKAKAEQKKDIAAEALIDNF